MNTSGDAAEQIVRISLEGTEVALKLTGAAAKNIAAMLYAVLRNNDQNKSKGRQRLTSMLKSGKELKVFTIPADRVKQFAAEAKRYGVVYCVLRDKDKNSDGMVDLLVRADDAPRINRIITRFKFNTVKKNEEKAEAEESAGPAAPEQDMPDRSEDDTLLDELLEKPAQKEKQQPENPAAEKTAPFQEAAEKSPPSAPTSGEPGRTEAETDTSKIERPSVREELRKIQIKRKKEETPGRGEQPSSGKKQPQKTSQHRQPKSKKKPKERG